MSDGGKIVHDALASLATVDAATHPAQVHDLIAQVGNNSGYLPHGEALDAVLQVVPHAKRQADTHPDNQDYVYRYGWILCSPTATRRR